MLNKAINIGVGTAVNTATVGMHHLPAAIASDSVGSLLGNPLSDDHCKNLSGESPTICNLI